MKKKYLIIFSIIFISSCDKSKKILNKSSEKIKSSINYLDITLVKKPIAYFDRKERISDSIEKKKITDYFNENHSKYKEYKIVHNWFDSNPIQLQNLKGNFYKIISSVIKEGKNITRNNYEAKSKDNTYKYFYTSKDFYFIFDLKLVNKKISCDNVRRIGVGFGDEEMYDIIYENNKLKKEIFQSYVNPELYEEEDNIYFEFSKELENGDLINTINLGKSIF